MKLNTDIYNVKNVHNEGTESEFWTSDPIKDLVNDEFDESILICRQSDDSPWNMLTDITSYNSDTKTADTMPCTFGVFPFLGTSAKPIACSTYESSGFEDTCEIITKYDYKKLLFTVQLWITHDGGSQSYYGTISELINDGNTMDYDGFGSLDTISIRALYNNVVINTNGYGNTVGGICKSDKYNFCNSANNLFSYNYDYLVNITNYGGFCLNSPPLHITNDSTYFGVNVNLSGMKKSEVIDFIRSLVARLGFLFTDGGGGVFGDNNVYLPEIKNGVSTGNYFSTNDLNDVTSDNIEWNDRVDIDTKTPDTTNDDDDIDDMELGVGGNYSGMIKYYRLSPAQLVAFSEAIQDSTVIPAGYDIFKNIIALKRYPINLDDYAEFSDAKLMKVGSVTLNLSASQLAFEKRNISLGKYTIPGYHGSKGNPHFLDFSPYTTAEVFIPYCGFVTLPVDKIMYNEIEVRLLVDIKLGNCTGIVKCNGNVVGEKAGILGSDIPLVAVNMGVAMGAIIQGLTDSTFGFASAIPYAATGNIGATFSGILNGTSALTQTIMSTKKNYTEVIGNTGGDIMFSMPDRCYIKLTYPKKKLPDNYGKMVGYMCGKGGRLGDFKGFTICENVHVNVKATEDEKKMILEKLLTGVIMPYNN